MPKNNAIRFLNGVVTLRWGNWYGSRKALEKRLVCDLGTTNADRIRYAIDEEIECFEPELQGIFRRWIRTGKVDSELSVRGWTLEEIKRRKGPSDAIAFSFWNGLIADREETEDLLRNPPRGRMVLGPLTHRIVQ